MTKPMIDDEANWFNPAPTELSEHRSTLEPTPEEIRDALRAAEVAYEAVIVASDEGEPLDYEAARPLTRTIALLRRLVAA
jgi:hypothetical protein